MTRATPASSSPRSCDVVLFITIINKLRLEIRSMDELHLDLKDLSDGLNLLSLLPFDFEG